MMAEPQQSPAGEPPAAAGLHTYELTIWEKAEHWRIYENVSARSEAEARALFAKNYGRGYRLVHVHCVR